MIHFIWITLVCCRGHLDACQFASEQMNNNQTFNRSLILVRVSDGNISFHCSKLQSSNFSNKKLAKKFTFLAMVSNANCIEIILVICLLLILWSYYLEQATPKTSLEYRKYINEQTTPVYWFILLFYHPAIFSIISQYAYSYLQTTLL